MFICLISRMILTKNYVMIFIEDAKVKFQLNKIDNMFNFWCTLTVLTFYFILALQKYCLKIFKSIFVKIPYKHSCH